MKRIPLASGAVLAMSAMAACSSSPPLHYYSLDAVSPASGSSAPAGALRILVRHISVPSEMDHRGLTHREGPTRVSIAESDQWSAPVQDLIQGVVSQDLGERMGYEHVIAPAALPDGAQTDPAAVVMLDLDFVSLEADGTCSISAQVNWTLTAGNSPRRGTARVSAPGGGCPAGLPAALSTALGTLADQLAPQILAR